MDLLQLHAELVTLTRLYLLREHTGSKRVPVTKETYSEWMPKKPPAPRQLIPAAPIENKTIKKTIPPSPITDKPVIIPSNQIAAVAKKDPEPIVKTQNPSEEKKVERLKEEPPKEKKELSNGSWKLNPLKTIPYEPFDDFKSLFSQMFPQVKVSNDIPTDESAVRIKESWKKKVNPSIFILSFTKDPMEVQLLENLAKAITHYCEQAIVVSLIAKETKDDIMQIFKGAKLVLAVQEDHSSFTNNHDLSSVPFLPLAHLSLYLNHPDLKASLWKSIKKQWDYIKSS